MDRCSLAATIAALALLTAACADEPLPAESVALDALGAAHVAEVDPGRAILMWDQCDPASFNAAVGPGTCINRNGGITFSTFIALLEKHQTVASWRFTPSVIKVAEGTSLPVLNTGGEVHTFTEVAEFGGGVVPILNDLAGTPDVAPECASAPPEEFVPSHGHFDHTFDETGAEKYQCCIDPWMRVVVTAR